MIVRVVAICPAAARDAVQAMLTPFLSGAGEAEFSVPLSPLSSPTSEPTFYGTCTTLNTDNSLLLGQLPALLGQLQGGAYQVVPLDQWFLERDWTAWLANRGLTPRTWAS